mgnify:CR=1 FL=1
MAAIPVIFLCTVNEPKLVRDGIPYGAGLLVEVGFYEEPKMLGEMRQALFVHQPRNIAPVRYVRNAPTDAGSWFASGLMTLEKRPPLGYIPMGTANDVATTLGLPKSSTVEVTVAIYELSEIVLTTLSLTV